MNTGKVFEQSFKKSVDESKIYFVRLKDSPASFGQDSSKVRFTADNPYDNFCFYERTLFPLELKSTKSTSFSFQRDKKEKGKNIKLTQIEGLTKASKYNGIYAGFVFNFDNGETVWMDIRDFNDFYNTTTKKSINYQDILQYDCVVIKKHLLKVNYRYEITKFLDEIIKKGESNAKKNI